MDEKIGVKLRQLPGGGRGFTSNHKKARVYVSKEQGEKSKERKGPSKQANNKKSFSIWEKARGRRP